ncbi:hypothetical protein DSM107010_65510 [Chroococcidiopsis cubana SAG 39.79]|uniref:Secreted protein n=1 Tax=Chroococcidiopsis cubana SAG 39.79 TaxID=388085 RepID=A0AB37U9S1_9CYAN|nr:hypothetical protein DSM107010_65510 [Chroococcidiopsis cubana SAG 39.79]
MAIAVGMTSTATIAAPTIATVECETTIANNTAANRSRQNFRRQRIQQFWKFPLPQLQQRLLTSTEKPKIHPYTQLEPNYGWETIESQKSNPCIVWD